MVSVMLYPCIFCDALFCKCVQNICTYVVSNVLTYAHYPMSRSNHDCLVKVIETHLLVMIWCVGEEGVVGHLRCGAACQEYQADRLQESHEGLILCIILKECRSLTNAGHQYLHFSAILMVSDAYQPSVQWTTT